jgi:hypothetical protein
LLNALRPTPRNARNARLSRCAGSAVVR